MGQLSSVDAATVVSAASTADTPPLVCLHSLPKMSDTIGCTSGTSQNAGPCSEPGGGSQQLESEEEASGDAGRQLG